MKSVGVREFRDQASQLLASGETLAIEKHGKPIGFYVPIVAKDRELGIRALDHLDAVIDRVLAKTAQTEDEMVAEILGDACAPKAEAGTANPDVCGAVEMDIEIVADTQTHAIPLDAARR